MKENNSAIELSVSAYPSMMVNSVQDLKSHSMVVSRTSAASLEINGSRWMQSPFFNENSRDANCLGEHRFS